MGGVDSVLSAYEQPAIFATEVSPKSSTESQAGTRCVEKRETDLTEKGES